MFDLVIVFVCVLCKDGIGVNVLLLCVLVDDFEFGFDFFSVEFGVLWLGFKFDILVDDIFWCIVGDIVECFEILL